MTLIVASLLGMLFDHSRRAALDPPRDAKTFCGTVLITVDPSSTTPPAVLRAILDEAAAVWRPLGVSVRESPHPSSRTSLREVRVLVTDDPTRSDDNDERLGWIRFGSSGDPESLIHLSRRAALD